MGVGLGFALADLPSFAVFGILVLLVETCVVRGGYASTGVSVLEFEQLFYAY